MLEGFSQFIVNKITEMGFFLCWRNILEVVQKTHLFFFPVIVLIVLRAFSCLLFSLWRPCGVFLALLVLPPTFCPQNDPIECSVRNSSSKKSIFVYLKLQQLLQDIVSDFFPHILNLLNFWNVRFWSLYVLTHYF